MRDQPPFTQGTALGFRFAAVLMLLAMTCSSQALHTDFLNSCSNVLAVAHSALTNNPSPTPQEQRDARAISRALKELCKPSSSVATDCGLFATATARLGALALDPVFLPSLTNALAGFASEAASEIDFTTARLAALTDFARAKKLAGNQLAYAQAALNSIEPWTEVRRGALAARRAFLKLAQASRLAAIAEAHAGFAPDSIVGTRLNYRMARGLFGFYGFTNSTHYEQAESSGGSSATTDEGTYAYHRTGLNTATLVLNGTGITNTMRLAYRTRTNGVFVVRSGSGRKTQSGTFTQE